MPTTFANTIDGNEILAKRSQCDYAGADIQTTYATKSEVTTGLASKQDTISDLATIRSGAADGATAVQPGDLSTVATTGAYSDLTGTPTIPTATSDLTNDSGFITLSDVPAQVNSDWNASSGAAEILNKPSIPSATSDLTNDSGFITLSDVPAQVQADWTESDTGDPSYIQNKPSIPSATSDLTNDSGFITLSDVPAQVNADWNSSSGASEILNKPTIPSGTQLVPAATSADEDKVLTVDSQGVPGWASAQAPISAGDGIDITNNVVSADVAAPLAINTDDEIWLKTGRGLDTQAGLQSDELEVRLSGTGGLMYDSNDDDGLAIQLAQYSGLEVQMNNGVQEGLNVLVDGTTIDKNASGELTVIGGGGGGTQADWTEDDPSDPSYIENKPTPKTLVAGTNIVITEDSSTITVTATAEPQVNADWNASSGVAQILNKPTIPSGAQLVPAATSADADKVLTVDAQGTPGWASAQAPITAGTGINITNNVVSVDTSVVATQTDLAGKEDVFDVGTGLEMDTSGSTPTLQVEAPVDIVAGPGIVIDNPDGNTLRVSMAQDVETVLCDTVSNSSCTLSEAYTNFERIRIEWQYGSSITDTEYSIVPMISEYYTNSITATTNKNVLMSVTNLNGNGSSANQFVTRAALWKFNGATTFEFVKGYQLFNGNITASTAINIRRIVGIHRIANN